MAYEVAHHGDENTTDYRCFITKDGDVVSPLHDIPLWADKEKGICNMIVEIPRGTNAKLEISLGEEANPIKQDVKKGKLRLVDDVYPYIGYIWNYGAFPQTWENPNFTHPETEAKGDNDPLDVCDIGQATGYRGQVKQVKVLGTLALIDEGETDWKVITIDVTDPRAADFNDISDVEKAMPGFTMATYEWFRTYKMPAGKPPNEFAFNGAVKDRAYALSIIEENYQFWSDLLAGKIENSGLCLKNRVVEGSHKVEKYDVAEFAPRVLTTAVQATFVAPEHPVAAHVTAEQRAKYFSVASLSSALAAIADSLGKENAVELLQANEHIRSVIDAATVRFPRQNALNPKTQYLYGCCIKRMAKWHVEKGNTLFVTAAGELKVRDVLENLGDGFYAFLSDQFGVQVPEDGSGYLSSEDGVGYASVASYRSAFMNALKQHRLKLSDAQAEEMGKRFKTFKELDARRRNNGDAAHRNLNLTSNLHGEKGAAGEGYWTVAFNAAGTIFGLYQKAGPHALKFDGSEAVASAGYDLVAAGSKGADGSFSYNAGYGSFTFNPDLQAAAAPAPAAAGGDLLGETAPLAFLAAF